MSVGIIILSSCNSIISIWLIFKSLQTTKLLVSKKDTSNLVKIILTVEYFDEKIFVFETSNGKNYMPTELQNIVFLIAHNY